MNRNSSGGLGRGALYATAVGMIIGTGVIAMTGIAIGDTGHSVIFAYLGAAILMAVSIIPFGYLGGTIRLPGGCYTQIGLIAPRFITGVNVYIMVFQVVILSLYGVNFADYLLELLPNVNKLAVEVIFVTTMFALNFFGTGSYMWSQVLMVVLMIIALTLYALFGVGKVDAAAYFERETFLYKGTGGFLVALATLSFATDGAKNLINFSGMAKNPTGDIPKVMLRSTLAVGVLYAVIAFVSAGVLPVETVANRPLSRVAYEIFPYWLYIIFMCAGALFAIATTLNAGISGIIDPLLTLAGDGWLPRGLTKLHPRFGTPYRMIITAYVLTLIPLLAGLDMNQLANCAIILMRAQTALVCFYTIRLPKVMPERWRASPMHVSDGKLKFVCILTGCIALFQIAALFTSCSPLEIVGNAVLLAGAVVLALCTYRKASLDSIQEIMKAEE